MATLNAWFSVISVREMEMDSTCLLCVGQIFIFLMMRAVVFASLGLVYGKHISWTSLGDYGFEEFQRDFRQKWPASELNMRRDLFIKGIAKSLYHRRS
jgi:hypothetical protein